MRFATIIGVQTSHHAAQAHISVASHADARNEVPAAEDHHEGHEEHEGEESENETLDAVLQFGGVEVDQQSSLHASRFHVS